MTYDSVIHYISIHAGGFAAVYALFKEMEWDKPIKKKINETIKSIYGCVSVWLRRKRSISGFERGSTDKAERPKG